MQWAIIFSSIIQADECGFADYQGIQHIQLAVLKIRLPYQNLKHNNSNNIKDIIAWLSWTAIVRPLWPKSGLSLQIIYKVSFVITSTMSSQCMTAFKAIIRPQLRCGRILQCLPRRIPQIVSSAQDYFAALICELAIAPACSHCGLDKLHSTVRESLLHGAGGSKLSIDSIENCLTKKLFDN